MYINDGDRAFIDTMVNFDSNLYCKICGSNCNDDSNQFDIKIKPIVKNKKLIYYNKRGKKDD